MDTLSKEQRQERLVFLRKQQYRNKQVPELLRVVSDIANMHLSDKDVLSIEQTVELARNIKYKNFGQASLDVTFPVAQSNNLKAVFSSLSYDINKINYFTTAKNWEYFFLLTDTSFVIDNFQKIIELDGDTFYVYDQVLANGLYVDTNEDYWTEENKTIYVWTYTLRVWGVDWIEKISKANGDLIRSKL